MDQENLQFLKDLRNKEKKAWKKLYSLYYPSLCNYTSRLINNEQDAIDIVQKIMINLWELNVNFANIKSLTAYLYKAARNSSITHINQKNLEYKKIEDLFFLNKTDKNLDDSMIMMVEEEMIRELYNGISELPTRQAEIMLLSSKGLSVKQVAEKLKVSVNTIKTQKKRAYATLKESLRDSLILILFFSF